ncbi:helicase protein MOM1-like isoform X2 [Lotus japonicus]|uniref:helicase protein MOM1-like isoform X2 n=1 Tax=Lotus japonicus TaxID=34305 RepID=UPI00258CBFAD|nr:helicase protein MOM1-like isoform X2 [Lotus japonicus]
MGNGTRSSQRAKDGENYNERMKQDSEKGKISPSPTESDTTGVRRSARETPSKKIIPSSSSARKSERLEKGTPPSPAVSKKSERVEKKNMPSPLRRSGRARGQSSTPSDSKSSGSLNSKQKQKSVKQVTLEAKEVNQSEEHDPETLQVKVKRMDARMYRSLFKKPKEGEETLQMSMSNSILDGELVRNGHDGGEMSILSKRKGMTVDMDSDPSASLSKDDNCNFIPNASPSMSDGNVIGTDGPYSKRVRLDYNPKVNESCNPSATEENIVGNINIPALLDSQSNNEKYGLNPNSDDSAFQLKDRLSSDIASRCKSDSCRFVEYWVPVQISDVQLEQYCAILLKNAEILRSSSKVDSVGAIRDILISIRKCCNHPYVVDEHLQRLLWEGLKPDEFLGVDIKASGKLQLLDSMLMELKKKDLRTLILFQSIGGSGRDLIGDILDDFLRQRFGPDSYERIDKSLPPSKKLAAMKKFNDKNNERFFFLLETCACLPSIKLSSVDTIIIFDSDWNPVNDIRSLQKITLDSQYKLIKMFRLYSAFTVEERALSFAKQDKTLDINLQNMNRGISHMLLMWSAPCLFDELKVFHDDAASTPSLKSLFGQPLLKQAIDEFRSVLSQDGEDTDANNCSILLKVKVQQKELTYRGHFSLLGELKIGLLDEEAPQIFWPKLLEGKHFCWKYSSNLFQRSRKKVHYFNGSVDRPDAVTEGILKKRKKVSSNVVDHPSSKSEDENLSNGIKEGASGDLVDRPHVNVVESEKKGTVHGEQRSSHLLLKPEITKLCEVLLLPDTVKSMVDNFLQYVMNNHHITRESVPLLQAFQLSLCWTAAALLKYKLGHKASLIRAKQQLNFECKKEEVDLIYSLLRCLKKIFLYRTGNCNDTGSPKASESSNTVYSYTGVEQEVELFKIDMSKSIKEIKKKFEKPLKKLCLLHQEEKQKLKAVFESEKAYVERKFLTESAIIRSCSPNDVMRTEKVKVLNIAYEEKIAELKYQHETDLKALEDVQLAQMQELQDKEAAWVEDVKCWGQNELLNIVASKELGTGVEYLQTCDQGQPQNGPKNHFSEGKGHSQSREQKSDGAPSMINEGNGYENFSHEPRGSFRDDSVGLSLPSLNGVVCDRETSGVPGEEVSGFSAGMSQSPEKHMPSLDATCLPVCENEVPIHVADDCNGSKSNVPLNSSLSDERIGGSAVISVLDREAHITVSSTDCPENVFAVVNPPSSMEQITDGDAVNEFSDKELSRTCGTTSPTNVADDIERQNSDGGSLNVQVLDGVIASTPSQAAGSSDGPVTISLSNPPLEEQIPGGGIPVSESSHNDIEALTNALLVDKSTMSDQEEGGPRTVGEFTLSQERLVSRSVNGMEPLGQGQELSSVGTPPDLDTAGELWNSSEQVSNSGHFVPANQPNHVSPIMIPSEKVHQLPAAELPSNMDPSYFPVATEDAHQPINKDDHPSHHSEASTVVPNQDVVQPNSSSVVPNQDVVQPNSSPVVPNQDVVQPNSSSELDLHSHQVVQPASNSNLDSPTTGGVRTQSSNPINFSTPLETNNHSMQTSIDSASRMVQHLGYDPLKNELERIQKASEQTMKNHEDMKLRLTSDFEKELEELRRKYDIKFQEIEVEFQQTKKALDKSFNTVRANKILADAFRSKCLDLKVSGASGLQQDSSSTQHLGQHPRQQNATLPPLGAGPSSCGPPATSLQSPSTTSNPQHTVTPIQGGQSLSGTLPGVSTRPPIINSISPSGNNQGGGEIRAPAPHLQPYRSSASVPASTPPGLQHQLPSQPSPTSNLPSQSSRSNIPATAPPSSHAPPQPKPITNQSDPMGRRPDAASGLATPKLPAMSPRVNISSQSAPNHPNVLSRMSDVASVNKSRLGTGSSIRANSPHQASSPNVVCLSDDE